MARKKDFWQWLSQNWLGATIGTIAIIIFYPILRNKFLNAKDAADTSAALNSNGSSVAAAGSNTLREGLCKAIVLFVIEEKNKTNQDEPAIVKQLNQLNTLEEVMFCSDLYKQKTASSLRADLLDMLDSDYNPLGWALGGRFSDLIPVVKNNVK